MSPRARRMTQHNPCQKETEASYKCLDENNYNRDMCGQFFDAYKACKQRWHDERAEARRKKYEEESLFRHIKLAFGFGPQPSSSEQSEAKSEAKAEAMPGSPSSKN
ncbi:hypothetical protein CAOG_004584 [Capsaspora owczarzaki ATCC 30864]|uniref:CHCH domain-containing protein n=2 Tax=Capsaspora owczarzaki (strain ATCC 30864) TaxID=595528 RepID=A0A0D2WQD3_CAPO3|nr:hypothetical protein CAOG_004584 [Capsaspora owczarzaki ATCC 30864]